MELVPPPPLSKPMPRAWVDQIPWNIILGRSNISINSKIFCVSPVFDKCWYIHCIFGGGGSFYIQL